MEASGRVFLVGAGPGDPELITVRGRDCLAAADLILHDYLINPALLRHARPAVELVCLGPPHTGRALRQDEINQRMINAARAGSTVVRLKCGDPYLFGRGAEEVEALQKAAVPFEIVPGVTAALAAAACTGIPITHRQFASAVALITGHQRADKTWPEADYRQLGNFPGTLVFYMGIATARDWSRALIEGGMRGDMPVAILRRLTWADQQLHRATVSTVADVIDQQQITAPALVIVGEVAALATEALGSVRDLP